MNYIGRVIDTEKQAPISGAKVSINLPGEQIITYTDLEGIYKFPLEFGNSNVLEGEITIEAKGYKTYSAFLRLSPEYQDLGDIGLVYPQAVSSSQLVYSPSRESENNIVLPVLAAIMVVFALIIAALTLSPSQKTQPSENQDNVLNFQNSF